MFAEKEHKPQQNSTSSHWGNAHVQTKLEIGAKDDPQEKEADEVAEKVMRKAEPSGTGTAGDGSIRRTEEDEEKKVLTMKEESVPRVQTMKEETYSKVHKMHSEEKPRVMTMKDESAAWKKRDKERDESSFVKKNEEDQSKKKSSISEKGQGADDKSKSGSEKSGGIKRDWKSAFKLNTDKKKKGVDSKDAKSKGKDQKQEDKKDGKNSDGKKSFGEKNVDGLRTVNSNAKSRNSFLELPAENFQLNSPEIKSTGQSIKNIEQLNQSASAKKVQMNQTFAQCDLRLSADFGLQTQKLNSVYREEVSGVSQSYDHAIGTVKGSLAGAKRKTAEGRKKREAQLKKNKEVKKKRSDKVVKDKQKELADLGESYAKNSIAHGNSLTEQAEKRRKDGKSTIDDNAALAVVPYAKYANFNGICVDVIELAEETKSQVDDSTNELNEHLKEDGDDLAEKFREDAKEAVSKLPEGTEATKNQIESIYQQGIGQFDGLSDEPLAELGKNLFKTLHELQAGKKEALKQLAIQKKQAEAKLFQQRNNDRIAMQRLLNSILQKTDETVLQADANLKQPKTSKIQLLSQSEMQLQKLEGLNDQSLKMLMVRLIGQQQGMTADVISAMQENATNIKNQASETGIQANEGAERTVDGILGGYDQVVTMVTDAMEDSVMKFSGELDKSIGECRTKWQGQFVEGTAAMTSKAHDVFAENDTLVAESKQQLADKAKDASEVSVGDFWDAVGGFFVGVFKAVLLIVAIILVVLAVVALLVLVFELLLAGIALIFGELAALVIGLIVEMIVSLVISLVVELVTFFAAELIALGIGMALYQFYKTSQDKSLSMYQKGEGYGEATVNLVLSLLPFLSWGKGASTAVTATEEAIATENAVVNAEKTGVTLLDDVSNDAKVLELEEFDAIVPENLNSGLFRRTKNIGIFSDLQVTMDLKNVKYFANQGGVGVNGIKLRIIRDESLLGKGVFGYTHPNGKMIDLYPDAFTDIETLIRTLGHERTHVFQIKTFGAPTSTSTLLEFEKAAYQSEDFFMQFFSKYGKTR